jgi:hypothetical protein
MGVKIIVFLVILPEFFGRGEGERKHLVLWGRLSVGSGAAATKS